MTAQRGYFVTHDRVWHRQFFQDGIDAAFVIPACVEYRIRGRSGDYEDARREISSGDGHWCTRCCNDLLSVIPKGGTPVLGALR